MSPKRGGQPHRATASRARERRSILVYTEGQKTEPMYLTHWHRMYQWAEIHRQDAQRRSSVLLACGKAPTPAALAELVTRYEDGRRRAQALDKKHDGDGSPPRSNPSSGTWQIIDQIKGGQ